MTQTRRNGGLNWPAAALATTRTRAATKPAPAHRSCSARKSKGDFEEPDRASLLATAAVPTLNLDRYLTASPMIGRTILSSGPKGVRLWVAVRSSRDSRF